MKSGQHVDVPLRQRGRACEQAGDQGRVQGKGPEPEGARDRVVLARQAVLTRVYKTLSWLKSENLPSVILAGAVDSSRDLEPCSPSRATPWRCRIIAGCISRL